jgi:hypothetical protein
MPLTERQLYSLEVTRAPSGGRVYHTSPEFWAPREASALSNLILTPWTFWPMVMAAMLWPPSA